MFLFKVEIQDRNKRTALSDAITNGHHEIASLLRGAGAVQHGFAGYKLAASAARGDLAALQALESSGFDAECIHISCIM